MRIIFMGSPGFGLPTLRALLAQGHRITLVVSQPDRPAGRSRQPTPPAVAAFARAEGLPLYQPATLRSGEDQTPLADASPELIIVAAFGLILPRAVLALPTHGCLNVHPSLLPRYRGASPIQAALLNGDAETGATIIKLTRRMDAGPILAQERTLVGRTEDAVSLEARLAELGARLLTETIETWVDGRLSAREQDEGEATYCPRLERRDAELDWRRPAIELSRVVRAFRGRTDAYTSWQGRLLKVLSAEPLDLPTAGRPPGSVFMLAADQRSRRPLVATGSGALALDLVQLEGRAASDAGTFINGYPGFAQAHLGGSC
jgi:methionyl-tRNA formyltransferase